MDNQNPPSIANEKLDLNPQLKLELPAMPTQRELQGEVSRLTQEVNHLNHILAAQSAELDSLRKAVQAWAVAQITEEDLRRYANEETGMPLEAFIAELEQPL